MSNDEIYINRCITLARYAEGKVAPNPLVGAVVVCNGTVIGEGYHRQYGKPHAEVNAINSVANKEMLRRSTLYVNLEPCSHYGKTPPCADLIVGSGIPKVVIGMRDVNPKVNGNGIRILRNAGIDVVEGILEAECRQLNRRFITFIEQRRPFVVLKWAQTADGFLDGIRYNSELSPLKISNAVTKTLNHQIRTQEAAIMIATRTALLDNPHLTVRKWTGTNPIRLLVDRSLKIPSHYNIFDQTAETIIFNEKKYDKKPYVEYIKLDFAQNIIPQILDFLYSRNIQSIIVEGGRQLLESFIESGLWDECHIESSQQVIGKGVQAPILKQKTAEKGHLFGKNSYFVYTNNKNSTPTQMRKYNI